MATDLAARGLRAIAEQVAGDPLALARLARQLRKRGSEAEAVELALQAIELGAADGEARVIAAEVLSKGAPRWHFGLVRDRARNKAYREAIERLVTPGCTVLEIGAGSGLLALMAAKAGAGRVITCEQDPAVAEVARRNVAANGLSAKIIVLNAHSTTLDPVSDLGGPADILISEILGDDLLSEGVLPSHADAVTRLLKPGAPVIPLRGRIMVALARVDRRSEQPVGVEEGFDLSSLNLLSRPNKSLPVHSEAIKAVGPASVLFEFAFDQTSYADGSTALSLGSMAGTVNGVLQWIELDLCEGVDFKNPPGADARSSWGCRFWPFAGPCDLLGGDTVSVAARHDDTEYRLWRTA